MRRRRDRDEVIDRTFWRERERRRPSKLVVSMVILVGVLAFMTIAGVAFLWPHGHLKRSPIVSPHTVGARVTRVEPVRCSVAGNRGCSEVFARILGGRGKGTTTRFEIARTSGFGLSSGDRIRVFRTPPPPKGTSASAHLPPYSFSDFDRRLAMLELALVFAVLLLVTGRIHGLRALIGLAASVVLVVEFMIPAILHGHSAPAVALVGSFAVMLVTIPLSYGLGAKAIAAWLGTAVSLLLAVGLASLFTHLAHLTGASSEEALFLSATQASLSLRGLLLAGMVIGALGVLVDLTVSQASTVIALRRANPALGFAGLFRGALDVGHDHIAATVNTLVFAYAGASLPVLLVFSIGGTTFTDGINAESVAEEVIAALVGSIGLIASMPITTALAALLAPRLGDRALRSEDAHVHAH